MGAKKKSAGRHLEIRSAVGKYISDGQLAGIPDPNAPQAISQSEAAKLCRDFNFDPQNYLAALIEHVNVVAQVYWSNRLNEWSRISNKSIKSEIRKVLRRTTNLESALNSLSPQSSRYFWMPEQNIDAYAWAGKIKNRFEGDAIQFGSTKFGHTVISVRYDDDRAVTFHINRDLHFESLKILQTYSERILNEFKSEKNGRPKSEALNLIMLSNVYFWRETLGREFHADYQKGGAANKPTHFVVTLAKIVDPNISERQAITVIRDIVRRRHTLPPLRNPSKI